MKGTIQKRGNSWRYVVDIGRDPRTGKRKQKTKSGFKTKKEAQAALAGLINSVEQGQYIQYDNTLFKDFALDYMSQTYQNRVKESTYDRMFSLLTTQILPYFGNIRLYEITHFLVHEFYNEKMKEGLSSSYVRSIHVFLMSLLRVAKKWELIPKDIASMIEPPRLKKKEMNVWSIEQINAFLKHTQHCRYHGVFLLAAYTGMRKGEILALSWDDINFEEKTISITKTLYKVKEKFTLDSVKTLNSVRKIYFDSHVEKALKRQKVKQNLEKMKFGLSGVSNQVFLQEDGNYVYPSSINALFSRYSKQIHLPKIRFHDLRHSHATILLEMGTNPKIVAERLGHSSVKITLDVYSHVLPSMQKDVSEQFSSVMRRNVTHL